MAQTCNANKGDLIEISRGLYQHWAVYIGENEVVHLVTEGGQSSGSSANQGSSSNGIVKREKLTDVVGNDHYQVNNLLDKSRKARKPSVIVKEACAMVGRKLKYDLVKYNCEHFATEMRYGKAESGQVIKAVIAGAAVGAGVAGAAVGTVGAGAAVGASATVALVAGAPVIAVAAAAGAAFAFCRALFRSRSSS